MIIALVQKDLKLFFRNQFNLVITVLSLGMFIVAFLALPDEVDQTLGLAAFVEDGVSSTLVDSFGESIELELYDSQEALIEAVDNGDHSVGVVLTNAISDALENGEQSTIPVYYAPGTNSDTREGYTDILAMTLNTSQFSNSQPFAVNSITEVLGPNVDEPTPIRNRIMPMLILVIFMVEMMGLSGLIVEEVASGTAQGILTTPLSLPQFFTSKAIIGVGLAFVQAIFLLAITGILFEAPLILLAVLLLTGVLISGIALFVAAVSANYMAVMGWGILFTILFIIPGIIVVVPGLGNDMLKIIPSYFVIDTIHEAINLNADFGDVASNLRILFVSSFAILGVGSAFLRRRLI